MFEEINFHHLINGKEYFISGSELDIIYYKGIFEGHSYNCARFNSIQVVYNFLTYIFSTYKREPLFKNEWSSIIFSPLNFEKLYLKKTIFNFASTSFPQNSFSPTLRSNEKVIFSTLRSGENVNKSNKYIYICGFDENSINVLFPKLSNVSFLAVQYTHPKLKEPIDITVPSSYFVVKNKLYSSAFVLRSLQYQPKYYIFDENYTLQIIDNEINTFELKSNQYVYIEENHYKILTL